MGSSYSDLKVYILCKSGTHKNETCNISTTKKLADECKNFEVVTHKIELSKEKPQKKPYSYNVLLCEGDEKHKGKCVFGYYPSYENEILDEVCVYFSIFYPDKPFIITFVAKGNFTYNCLYSDLISAGWDYASYMGRYNIGKPLDKKKLLELYRRQSFNRKIQLKTDNTENVDISVYKQQIGSEGNYRIVFIPKGNESVLRSDCLFSFDSDTKEFKCPKPAETKPQPESNAATSQSTTTPKANNQIDPYYLTSVENHFFDGIMVYFVNDEKDNKKPGANGVSSSNGNNNSQGNNGKGSAKESQNPKCDYNMAVLLDFVDECGTKQFVRKDKDATYWAKEEVEYKDDTKFNSKLNELCQAANKNVVSTFILEKKNDYKGVSVSHDIKDKITYTKYTHKASKSEKPNIIFEREVVAKIDKYETTSVKTTSLDVYFLKIGGKEDEWPFILMFKNEKTDAAKPANGGGNGGGAAPAAPAPAAQSPNGTKAPTKRCFYFDTSNDFGRWHELKVDEKSAESTKKDKQENDIDKKLEAKLTEKLDKIEANGKCQTDLYLLRKVAFYILNTDEVDDKEIKKIEKIERPPILHPYIQKGIGTTLPIVLGSVLGGLVVLGTMGAIIYGIYWYNTTIKLLT